MPNFECPEMQWPSKRIPPGGVLHNHKVEYSPGTQQFIKLLMDEAKFTLSQKREINFRLRSGSSVSDLTREDLCDKNERESQTTKTYRPRTSRRRPLSAIITSDAFQIERYRPKQRNEDRDVIKKKLQDIMEFGKKLPPPVRVESAKKQAKELPSKKEMLNDLLIQIKERSEWLQEMEELGEGVKHREVITDQIAERIRKIDSLKLTDDDINQDEDKGENMHFKKKTDDNGQKHSHGNSSKSKGSGRHN